MTLLLFLFITRSETLSSVGFLMDVLRKQKNNPHLWIDGDSNFIIKR